MNADKNPEFALVCPSNEMLSLWELQLPHRSCITKTRLEFRIRLTAISINL